MATATHDLQQNKDLCRGYLEDIINQHNPDACDRYFDVHASDDTLPSDVPPGIHGIKQGYREMLQAFPDARVEIHDMVAEGDTVAIRWTFTGTHKGEFVGVAPTNKRVEVQGCEFDEIRNGKITRIRGVGDTLRMLIQLGQVQVPERLANA